MIFKNKKVVLYTIIVRIVAVLILLVLWEYMAKSGTLGSRLVFPALEDIGEAFLHNFTQGYAGISLWIYICNSLILLLKGLVIGILFSCIFSGLAILSKGFFAVYNLLVSIFDLLPGIAMMPVIIIIFGVRLEVIVFLVVHAVLWPMSRNLLDGFMAVPQIYVDVGKNIGLKRIRLIIGVYLPASMSYIISGLKVAWARAWRGLISAEMIFGIASCPGLGLYINQMRMNMNNAEMYAVLVVIIIIGIIVQYGILEPIEKHTVKKWGMTR